MPKRDGPQKGPHQIRPPGQAKDRSGIDVFEYYRFLRAARTYVLEHLTGDVSLDAVSRAAGLERKYFSFLFRARTGLCFKDWVRSLRIDRAVGMLESCDDSIAKVGRAVGYRDLRTFERAFRRIMEVSPQQFRRRVQASLSARPQPKGSVLFAVDDLGDHGATVAHDEGFPKSPRTRGKQGRRPESPTQ